jgi:DNA replication and repair protein RecF
MGRLEGVHIHQLRSHTLFTSPLSGATSIMGANGSGKTNILESLYLGINGILPQGRTLEQMITRTAPSGFVRLSWETELGASIETTVSLSRNPSRQGYLYQGSSVSRPELLRRHGMRAMLFSPIEMNILYLGPSLRRDLLDEALLLSHSEFARVRREYALALRSRNVLLKRIAHGESDEHELDAWDLLLSDLIVKYSRYRDALIAELRTEILPAANMIRAGLEITLDLESKLPRDLEDLDQIAFVRAYLRDNRARDIVIGHATIGPHLDDFGFFCAPGESSTDFLSRGENKTLLLLIKLTLASYIERITGGQMIFLLDDIAAELDQEHFEHILSRFSGRSFVVTGHRIPQEFLIKIGSNTIQLNN